MQANPVILSLTQHTPVVNPILLHPFQMRPIEDPTLLSLALYNKVKETHPNLSKEEQEAMVKWRLFNRPRMAYFPDQVLPCY